MKKRGGLAVGALGLLAAGCGAHATLSVQVEQSYLNAVYAGAPDISSYRSSTQLVSLGQAVCEDLGAGASVEQVGDRLPYDEGSVTLPPAALGTVIYSAVKVLCPKFSRALQQ